MWCMCNHWIVEIAGRIEPRERVRTVLAVNCQVTCGSVTEGYHVLLLLLFSYCAYVVPVISGVDKRW